MTLKTNTSKIDCRLAVTLQWGLLCKHLLHLRHAVGTVIGKIAVCPIKCASEVPLKCA
ncbi:hypothetical protein DPMN_035803 [Dreissena polymorpha]|uniref:Uncharacterized protein n=1 Tax=Dreissena polymorpha TaxID=45954 RepID=A0A9D4M892_DREPO|nr:hypothetical protein DPMN_035803 [Dreissena polymorpha]